MANHGKISRYLENKIVRATLRGEQYSPPATVYLGLFTTVISESPSATTEAMVGTEVSGGAYARQSIAFEVPVDGETSNTSSVQFPLATADWGSVTHWAIFDAATGGNMLYFGSFDTPRTYTAGLQAVVAPNRIVVKVD